ncbi:MAG: ricin-type beta-trefoil lectin domain protein [Methyloglobulus sp.]|nr:RICIN domain-containing protein [Methyloglobulus sp.]
MSILHCNDVDKISINSLEAALAAKGFPISESGVIDMKTQQKQMKKIGKSLFATRGVLIGGLVVGMFAISASVSAEPRSTVGWLVNRASGKCADTPYWNAIIMYDPVYQSTCFNMSTQYWEHVVKTPGTLQLRNYEKNLCIRVRDRQPSSSLFVGSCNPAHNDTLWTRESTGGGYYRYCNVYSTMCMTVATAHGVKVDGIRLMQWPRSGYLQQQWKYFPKL